MNYFPFHIGDYAVHTRHLTLMEDLAYRRLLDLYYTRETCIDGTPEEVARLIGMREQVAEVDTVLNEFFEGDGRHWVHARCDAEIERMQIKQDKARASAAASVKARSTNAQRTLNERSTGVELPTPTPTPKEEITHTPLASDWVLVKPEGEWAAQEFPHWTAETIRSIAEQFRDHYRASGGTSADWSATWRKWCRDEITQRTHPPPDTKPRKAAPASQTVTSGAADQTAAYLAEQARLTAESKTPEALAAKAEAMARLRKVAA